MSKFETFLNWIAAIIIFIVVVGILVVTGASFYYSSRNSQKISTIKIEYHGIKTDSVNELNKIEIKKIDSLLTEIKKTSNNIELNQLQLIDNKENDSFFNKFYTAVAAIILSIAGFFGFKSISEVKLKAIEVAKDETKKVVNEEFDKTFDEKYRKAVNDEATAAMITFLKDPIEKLGSEIREQLKDLESRISILEGKRGENTSSSERITDIDDNNIESENIFK